MGLDRLVDALLTFAQAEGGALVANRQPTDITGLTQDCVAMFRSAAEVAGLTLTVDVPPTPTVVDIDPEMWSRIILSLLSNAYKFTWQGRIDVVLRVSDHSAVLEVRDTGIGIEADDLDRVFERLTRSWAPIPGPGREPGSGSGWFTTWSVPTKGRSTSTAGRGKEVLSGSVSR